MAVVLYKSQVLFNKTVTAGVYELPFVSESPYVKINFYATAQSGSFYWQVYQVHSSQSGHETLLGGVPMQTSIDGFVELNVPLTGHGKLRLVTDGDLTFVVTALGTTEAGANASDGTQQESLIELKDIHASIHTVIDKMDQILDHLREMTELEDLTGDFTDG